MKKFNAFLVSVLSAAALNAAVIEQVIVRQQWPWSTDVKVEYKISGVTAPVDISVKAFNGDRELALPVEAIAGDRCGIVEDGVGTLVIDPVKAFGTAKVALANFKVRLTIVDSPANMSEVLYKIFDLSDGSCKDVTRADILNGKMGPFETSFSAIGEGFRTDLPDVLIWTGVTNDTKYATDFLVMRRISAKDVEWQMGSPADEVDHYGDEPIHAVKLTNDFYIGVFPITVAQADRPSLVPAKRRWEYGDYTKNGDKNLMPATMDLYYARGDAGMGLGDVYFWPRDGHAVSDDSYLGKLRQLTNNRYEFDLPTEAQWEFACRAGTTTVMYDGKSYSKQGDYFAAGQLLGWSNINSDNGFWPVGLLKPNAFGLYDMVGNLQVFCLDTKADDYGGTDGVSIEPKGPEVEVFNSVNTVRRGGFYAWDPTLYRSARRFVKAGGGTEGIRVVFPAD